MVTESHSFRKRIRRNKTSLKMSFTYWRTKLISCKKVNYSNVKHQLSLGEIINVIGGNSTSFFLIILSMHLKFSYVINIKLYYYIEIKII